MCYARLTMRSKINQRAINEIKESIKAKGLRGVADDVGVTVNTIKRAVNGLSVSERTREALKRLPPSVRTREEFEALPRLTPNRVSTPATSWSVETIRNAIDAQMRGSFATPKRLAEAMRRDDAIFTARSNRTAPVSSIATKLEAHDSASGSRIACDAQDSIQVARTVLRGIVGTFVDHGVAIGYVVQEPNAQGTRIDMRLTEWPIEHVYWDDREEVLKSLTREGEHVSIVHGDGRWIIFRRTLTTPWREEAAVLPAGLVWAAHAEGVAHWQASSRAHGLAKILGAMPEGYELSDASGAVPTVVQKFIDMIEDLASGDAQTALRPFGSEVEFLANGSNAWQVFSENIVSREKAAARIYLGTDAILGSVGGAPGIDISALFGVATTKLQGDFTALEEGLYGGLYAPWTAINHGESSKAPRLRFALPDPDAERMREEGSANFERFTSAIASLKANGMLVTQDTVAALARQYSVTPMPQLASIEAQATTIQLAPTDIAKVVRVREAASQGLPPFGDERDDLTIDQLAAKAAAEAQAPAPEGAE